MRATLVLKPPLDYLHVMSTNPDTHPGTTPGGDEDIAASSAPETLEQIMKAAASRIAELEAALAEREAERDDMRDRWMRSEAEMVNVRARAKRDVDETRQYAVQKFARDVAEGAENLKRGLDSIPPASEGEPEIVGKLREGFAGVERSFVALLERNGIVRADPTGALFNPEFHQAMAEHETDDHPAGTVIQAWTQGWTLNGRILHPAMVVVAKATAPKLDTKA
jgi:molecular chaperone GrpE